MAISYQDFFRPDPSASNRSLRKYLEGEGLDLGFRDLVALRAAAEKGVYLSFALLEAWAEGEFAAGQLQTALQLVSEEQDLDAHCEQLGWSWTRTPEGTCLLGVEGEIEPIGDSQEEAGSPTSVESTSLVPLSKVYGTGLASSSPGAGGLWNEDELQADSVTLLDGESDTKLVEAFRHLFRAAPDGRARAAVVATALARHRHELNMEVARKLEEIAPALGQGLRQIFSLEPGDTRQALHFLLSHEAQENPPDWVHFWRQIRNSVLESLTHSEVGREVLRGSLEQLSQATRSNFQDQVLTHRLLEALMEEQEMLGPRERSHLLHLLVCWTEREPSAVEILESRLKLAPEQSERILLGEALRQSYARTEDEAALGRLMERFSREALSVGSTGQTLAISQLLSAFGPPVLRQPALASLRSASPRQTLRAVEIWESMAAERPEDVGSRVAELFVQALDEAPQHLGLLLKSSLLEREEVYQAFLAWCREADVPTLRKVVAVGHHWSLAVNNRPRVARALAEVEWHGEELWEQEWRKAILGYQRLGWLGQCLSLKGTILSKEVEERLLAVLEEPPRNLYFWDLLYRVAGMEGLSEPARQRLVEVSRELFGRLESNDEEERRATRRVAVAVLKRTPQPEPVLERWGALLKEGRRTDLWWVFGLVQGVFSAEDSTFLPERGFVAALIQRLFQSGPVPMQRVLAEALRKDEEDLTVAPVLSLELQNLGLEALAAVASHPECPAGTRAAIHRRLGMFLLAWTDKLAATNDVYSFRSTPLFELLKPLLDDEESALQRLLDQVVGALLDLQKKDPEKLRLEVRDAAQQFLRRWVECRSKSDHPSVGVWTRVLDDLASEQPA